LKIRPNQALLFDSQNVLFARPLFLTDGAVLGVPLAVGTVEISTT